MTRNAMRPAVAVAMSALALGPPAASGQSFVNWETPHVSPVTITPDGARLLACNLADNRLEVYDISTGSPVHEFSVPVGLDPVSVRARSNNEVWVINHISDSISIIDLGAQNVVRTLATGDEPCDVIFAGTPERAFVSISQENAIELFDPADLSLPSQAITLEGEDPRAMLTDGTNVYVAFFEGGNGTTILNADTVSGPMSPHAGQNPPPNAGAAFDPPIGALPTPPETGLIVRKQSDGTWQDDNAGDWSAAVAWDLHDHDLAIINATTLSTEYATGLMNANMGVGLLPSGEVTVVGTDGTNEVRFEPNINGVFHRVQMATVDPTTPTAPTVVDLNQHLDYSTASVDQEIRNEAIGDPRAVAWTGGGFKGYIASMGTDEVVAVHPFGFVLARISTGEGPTGLALDEPRDRLYAMNKFDGSISVIDTTTDSEIDRISFFDPTPDVIKVGRPHLYNTHKSSGLGHASCASCHIDGRTDTLAWGLGVPDGSVKPLNQLCTFGLGGCEDWHPMKGPLVTQSLINIIGTAPFHWRGDREDLNSFNTSFTDLLGDDAQLSPAEMDEFLDFIGTTTFPPNPFRNLDNSLPTSAPNGGDATNGESLFGLIRFFDNGGIALRCNQCHNGADGTNSQIFSSVVLGDTQSFDVPQLRGLNEKTGFAKDSQNNNRGFGYTHDGSFESIIEFLEDPRFDFDPIDGPQERLDLEAFLFAFSNDTHAGVGTQTTVTDGAAISTEQGDLLDAMIAIAEAGDVGLVVKGVVAGEQRGYAYRTGGSFQSDRSTESVASGSLRTMAAAGSELTFTVVPIGSEDRIGLDRDEDGAFDRDEIDVCTSETDPTRFPGSPLSFDQNGDGLVDVQDLLQFLSGWFAGNIDFNGDTVVDVVDLLDFLAVWFFCQPA